MQRYFVKELDTKNHTVAISGQDVHHIRNVMRLKEGDQIVVNSYKGRVFLCEIQSIFKTNVLCRPIEEIPSDYTPLNLTLGLSLIKRDKFELALQKATELGVKCIIPLKSENSIIRIDDFASKHERYLAIVKEASEQCERTVLPEIEEPVSLSDIDFDNFDQVIVAYAREDTKNRLSEAVKKTDMKQNILLVVGPEGGFSTKEIDYLKTRNVTFVSLGKTILRAETAAIYMISAFKLHWEN